MLPYKPHSTPTLKPLTCICFCVLLHYWETTSNSITISAIFIVPHSLPVIGIICLLVDFMMHLALDIIIWKCDWKIKMLYYHLPIQLHNFLKLPLKSSKVRFYPSAAYIC